MFRGNRTPDDLSPIDSTDNAEQIAVKSAWNLSRYGTSWPELLAMLKQAEMTDDSLQYVAERAGNVFDPENNYYGRSGYTIIPVRTEDAKNYDGGGDGWLYRAEGAVPEEEYFKYLDAIYGNPVPSYHGKEFPLNKEAEYYQEWKKAKGR